MIDPAEEAELVAAARRGSADAFTRLVRHYQDFVYRFVLRRCRERADAADIAQEAFFRAWQRLDGFRGQSRFSTWVVGIARNVLRESFHRRDEPSTDDDDLLVTATLMARRSDEPEFRTRRARLIADIEAAIGGIPSEWRETFVMVALEGLTYEEVAATLGVAIGTVKSRINRSRERLRMALRDVDLDLLAEADED